MRGWFLLPLCCACAEPGHFNAAMSFADPPAPEEPPLNNANGSFVDPPTNLFSFQLDVELQAH